jgi:hypothetical protein
MTTVTGDVIRDLLPLYAAGEASADTRALVEEFLTKDPELRALTGSARTAEIPTLPRPEGLHSLELESLDRTRRLLGRKTWLAALSLFFSLLPMTLAYNFGGRGLVFLMARDQPAISACSLAVGLLGWVAFLNICRRLSATGLQQPPSIMARTCWLISAALLGIAMTLVLKNWTGDRPWLWLLPGLLMGIAAWLGTHWRQIREPKIRQRPIG